MKIFRTSRLLCRAVLASLLCVSVCSGARAAEQELWDGGRFLDMAGPHLPQSCHYMGVAYYFGLGVEQDVEKALHWYTLGAEAGDIVCCTELAKMYKLGILVPRDSAKAVAYMLQAARGGNSSAIVMLAWCYLTGDGVEKNPSKGVRLLQQGARLKNSEAYYWLGYCYGRGYGVEKDEKEALGMYSLGAFSGDPNCMAMMGMCYATGRGTLQNLPTGLAWLHRSAEGGCYNAQRLLQFVKVAQATTPVPDEQLPQLGAEECWAQYLHRLMITDGYGSKAEAWRARAVELGHPLAIISDATEKMGWDVPVEQNARYVPLLERAAHNGEYLAALLLNQYYTAGFGGEFDARKSVEWMQRLVPTESADIAMGMADAAYFGFLTGKPDVVQTTEWLRKAAAKKNRIAVEVLPSFEHLLKSHLATKKN